MTETRISESASTERQPLKFVEQKTFNLLGLILITGSISQFIAAYGMLMDKTELFFKICLIYGSVSMLVFSFEMVWHTRAVKYNEKIVRIVVSRFLKIYHFRFKDIKNVELNDDELSIYNRANYLQMIDLKAIKKEDQEKLMVFLKERIRD